MINNTRVYALAEFYDIPDLKRLAAQKFSARVDNDDLWDLTDFISVIREIYSSTPPGESRLRLKISMEAANLRQALLGDEDFVSQAEDIPQFMSTFTREVVWASEREIAELSIEATKRREEAHKERVDLQERTDDLIREKSCMARDLQFMVYRVQNWAKELSDIKNELGLEGGNDEVARDL